MISYINKPSTGITYTRLWTNDSPTTTRGAFTVTLSEAATNYDALRIVWKYNATANVTEETWSNSSVNAIAYYYDIRNKRNIIVSGTGQLNMGAVLYAQSYAYARRAYFTADNKIYFSNAYQFQNSGTDTNTSMLIPLFIDGVTNI